MSGQTSSTADRLIGLVKRNPEGLLLLAAGAALLLRTSADAPQSMAGMSGTGSRKSMATKARNGISDAVDDAKDYAGNVADQAKSKIGDLTDTVSEAASKYGETARQQSQKALEQSQKAFGQMQSTAQGALDRVLQEQPLAIAIAGLAAGAVIAAAFPSTEIEQDTLGPLHDRVSEAAEQIGERLKDATAQAGERLKNSAQQRGLTADGLKEMASDAASAFSDGMSGNQSR